MREQDFKEQVIHHTATLTLLSFSWISNYIRIGTIVMALHDCSDILLEVSAHVTPNKQKMSSFLTESQHYLVFLELTVIKMSFELNSLTTISLGVVRWKQLTRQATDQLINTPIGELKNKTTQQ